MVQMIQLTRGQEETLHRITTALEKIAENSTQPKPTTESDDKGKLFIVVRVDKTWKFSDIDGVATSYDSAERLIETESVKPHAERYDWTIVEYNRSDIRE